MHRTSLASLTPHALSAAFNTVYTGYVVPFTVNEAWVLAHVAAMDIMLDHSPLWLDDDGNVLGLAALGVRDERGWVGGFGIAPAARGRGLSHTLIAALLDEARTIGLQHVALEVLTHNPRALRTYERAGFTHHRDLHIFASDGGIPTTLDTTVDATVADPAILLKQRATIGAPFPPWQREQRSLEGTPNLFGLAVGPPEFSMGYLLYRPSERAVVIADIAVADASCVAPLIRALATRFPHRPIQIVNEPEESAVCAALISLGWTLKMRQHEMIWACRSSGSSG